MDFYENSTFDTPVKPEQMAPETGNPLHDEPNRHSCIYIPMSKLRIMKNLAVLCLGFTFLFSAFMALANLQSTMNNADSIGVVSQSTIYGALMISSLFLPKLIIRRIGCKWTILISLLTYSPYIGANFYPKTSTLLPTALLLGIGAGTLWSSGSTYINVLSFLYEDEDSEQAAATTSLFFGIFIMCFQTTQIWGNLVSYYVLRPSDVESTASLPQSHSENITYAGAISCGASFCGGLNETLQPVSETKRSTLIAIFLTFSILSAVVVSIFLDPLKRKGNLQDSENKMSMKLIATFKHMMKVDQLLLIALTTFSGLEQGFIFSDYTQAYVACAWGLQHVGLVFVCYGIVNAIVSVWCGRLAKFIPRVMLMTGAAVSNFCVCIALLVWEPYLRHTMNFYLYVSFWAISDAIWQTQLSTLYGVLFRSDEEAAFANYRLWESLGYLIAFGCSSLFCMSSKIYMQIVFLIVGMVGYTAVEYRTYRRKKSYSISKPM